jgi:hypothetical protein
LAITGPTDPDLSHRNLESARLAAGHWGTLMELLQDQLPKQVSGSGDAVSFWTAMCTVAAASLLGKLGLDGEVLALDQMPHRRGRHSTLTAQDRRSRRTRRATPVEPGSNAHQWRP